VEASTLKSPAEEERERAERGAGVNRRRDVMVWRDAVLGVFRSTRCNKTRVFYSLGALEVV